MAYSGIAYGLAVPITALVLGLCWEKAYQHSSPMTKYNICELYFVSVLGALSLLLMTMHNCSSVTTAKRIGPDGSPLSMRISEIMLPGIIAFAQLLCQLSFLSGIYKRNKSRIFGIICGGLSMIEFLAAVGMTIVSAMKQYQRRLRRAEGQRVDLSTFAPYQDVLRGLWLFSAVVVNAALCGMSCVHWLKSGKGSSKFGGRQAWIVKVSLLLLETSMLNFILSFLVAVLSVHVAVANSNMKKTPIYGVFVFIRLIQLPATFLTIVFTLEKESVQAPEILVKFEQARWSDEKMNFSRPQQVKVKETPAKFVSVYTTTEESIWV
ncbi:hypothetical protein CROQUDRAFT_652391 [Cronartium quercuum f. sp. fusiforme G11]|uniref:Uncharacterized protein n=1 Tax=Cronartium quercuum f. sp. fusiforme G11 TaxID=708437 RepID=A0A9P6TFJ0_9BASI|nr:hypothetical protein CROQUDRAFT_652391 [Cronartium quercuum f. sp. fusiforme G11]